MKTIFLAAVLAMASACLAQATTVEIFETNAPGGDYADALGASTNNFGVAPAGTTGVIVYGDMRCGVFPCTGGLNDQTDAFFFNVGTDQSITEISFNSEGGDAQLTAQLIDTSDDSIIFTIAFATNNTVDLLTLINPALGPGTYNFVVSIAERPDLGAPGDIFYSVSATIVESMAPIPLPAGAWLMLGGLGGLTLLRRRQRAA